MSDRIVLISPGGTTGWRFNEAELAASLERLGFEPEVRRAMPRRARRLLGFWPIGSLLVALAARRETGRALDRGGAAAILAVNSTSALLLPWRHLEREGVPVAIRIDSPASELWPGPAHALQRRLERRALARCAVALATGRRSAELVKPLARRTLRVPVPLPQPGPEPRAAPGPYAVTYAGDPAQRGLDRVAAAWNELSDRGDAPRLVITGIDPADGKRRLAKLGSRVPESAEWAGVLGREAYLELLAGAAAFVSFPREEGHGIAQLEALALGVPLVTAPARGAHEAESPARELAPALVARGHEPKELADAVAAALELSEDERRRYAEAGRRLTADQSAEAADLALGEALRAIGLSA